MLKCPTCRRSLDRVKTRKGLFYLCPDCHGRAVALPVVRKLIGTEHVTRFWRAAVQNSSTGTKKCPICDRWMREIQGQADDSAVVLDLCRDCQFIWFDDQEIERFPPPPEPPAEKPLPPKVREQLAKAKLELESRRDALDPSDEPPDEAWHWIVGFLGMPVEKDVAAVRYRPWATWLLAGALVLAFVASLAALPAAVEQFSLVPRYALRLGGLTFLSCFFLHAGLMHLFSNVYFLLVFGDNVEDILGRTRYLLLLLGATLAGSFTHCLCDLHSSVPCVGASGGVSGVIAFYALSFPRAKLGILFRYYVYFRWLWFSAFAAFMIWLALQFVLAYMQAAGVGRVSAFAHLGGAAVGIGAWFLWKGADQSE